MINKNSLKNKKNSINYVYKITKSMEMISISKYRNLFKKKININLYLDKISKLINNLEIYENNFFFNNNNKKIKNILYIVISTDQGLCGNLNFNIYKYLIKNIKLNKFYKKNIYFFFIGKKSNSLIEILKFNKIKFFIYEYIFYNNIKNISKKYIFDKILNFFKKKKKPIIYIVGNNINYKNKNYLYIEQLLPLIYNNNNINRINYIYEYNKKNIIKKIIFEYINSKIYNCLINNIVSEYSTRIFIVKNASINSENLLKKINLIYNKLRQFNITKEIIGLSSSL